jgi:flavin-dependent dehydrogenase
MAEQPDQYDVAIVGGGLAGLTLGIQLKKARPDTNVLVTVGRKGPAPEAAFKVGESTVEISAHYFAHVIGLKEHIEERQLHKFGLRYFFPAGDNTDITQRLEFGPSRFAPVPSYQLDRGRYENELWQRVLDSGAVLLDDLLVDDIQLGEDGHEIAYTRSGEKGTAKARWLVDTTGRAALLRNKLNLTTEVAHKANASWFRLSGGLTLDDFSDDPEWSARVEETGYRWLSTNHLIGAGYWVWLIPLASGPISIGIVSDPRLHPYEEVNTLEAALGWIERHEPQLYTAIADRRDQVEDFLTLEDFAYGTERVYSQDRWALSGEAAMFLDPFYSPGSDFIAMGNTFITDLVTRDLDGEDIADKLEFYNAHILQLFQMFLYIYTNQYPGFGNPISHPAKLVYDHAIYFSINCPRFLSGRLTNFEFTQKVAPFFLGMLQIMPRLEQVFVEWRDLVSPEPRTGFINLSDLPGVAEIWAALGDLPDDDDELAAHIGRNVEFLEAFAVQVFFEAASALPDSPLPEDATINPAAMSLHPERWEEEGLFNGEGMTLAEARERAPGLDHLWQRGQVEAG